MPLISCRDVSIAYENNLVLSNISFDLNPGEYLCIAGENGSGKTTLLKGILGLIAPRSGEIVYDGVNADEIGYLPQQTPVQRDFPASVFEVVLSGCLNRLGLHPFYSQEEKERAQSFLEKLEISDLKDRSYRTLSGGQQQRVLLARALCATRRVLVMDEPVARLDPVMTADFYALLEKFRKEMGIAVIMVSHDIGAVLKNADKVLHIDRRVLFYGSAADYMESEIGKRFLGGDADD